MTGGQRKSFSDVYAKKLEEKQYRKALIEERSFREGNSILSREHVSRGFKRNSRLVSETLREVQRKVNFRYREKMFH